MSTDRATVHRVMSCDFQVCSMLRLVWRSTTARKRIA